MNKYLFLFALTIFSACYSDEENPCSSQSFRSIEMKLSNSTTLSGYVWLKEGSCPEEKNRKTYEVFTDVFLLKIPNYANTIAVSDGSKTIVKRTDVVSLKSFPFRITNACWVTSVDSKDEYRLLSAEKPTSYYHLERDEWFCEILCFDKSINKGKLKKIIDKKNLKAIGQKIFLLNDPKNKNNEKAIKYRKIKNDLMQKYRILIIDGWCYD